MEKHKKTPRHLSRSLAVQGMYYYKLNQTSVIEIEAYLSNINQGLYEKANYELLHYLLEHSIHDFDAMLALYTEYLERELVAVNLVEQIILVIAAVELTYSMSVPAVVIVNEAVELTKLYGAEDSYKFINSLVDRAAKKIRPNEAIRSSRSNG